LAIISVLAEKLVSNAGISANLRDFTAQIEGNVTVSRWDSSSYMCLKCYIGEIVAYLNLRL